MAVALSDDYNVEMQQKMGTSLTYCHENGMNYNRILDDLIVGSCPQVAQDVNTCAPSSLNDLPKRTL